MDMLLSMNYFHLNAIFLINMLGQMLCGIDRTVLSASTSETKHKRGKATLNITLYMVVSKLIYWFQKLDYLSVVFQKAYNRLIETCQFLIGLIAARIVCAAAIKDITTTVAAWIFWYSLSI